MNFILFHTQTVLWDQNAFSAEDYKFTLQHAVEACEESESDYLVVVTFCSHQQLSHFMQVAEEMSHGGSVDVFAWTKPDTTNVPGNRYARHDPCLVSLVPVTQVLTR